MQIENTAISLRFDGLDADAHEIDLFALGEALQGFARIISTVGHFAVTQTYSKNFAAHSVKTVAKEPVANCYKLDLVLNWAQQNQIFTGSVGTLLAVLIPLIFARHKNKTEEMKMLKDALDKAIAALGNRDQFVIDRLAATIEKMAEELRPSARQAISPVGVSCETISIIDTQTKQCYGTLNQEDKNAVATLTEKELTGIREFTVTLSEMDKEKATCKVTLPDIEHRLNAIIADPAFEMPNNDYFTAFVSGKALTIQGKATIKNSEISKLYIMNVVK